MIAVFSGLALIVYDAFFDADQRSIKIMIRNEPTADIHSQIQLLESIIEFAC